MPQLHPTPIPDYYSLAHMHPRPCLLFSLGPSKLNPRFLLCKAPPSELPLQLLAMAQPLHHLSVVSSSSVGGQEVVSDHCDILPTLGGPSATDGGARANRAGGYPPDGPAENEVSITSQWASHARFAHVPGVPKGQHHQTLWTYTQP